MSDEKQAFDAEKWYSFGTTPQEIIDGIIMWSKGTAEELSWYDTNDIKDKLKEIKQENPKASALTRYEEAVDYYQQGFWGNIFEARDFTVCYFPHNKNKIYDFFKGTEVLPIIIEIAGIFEQIVEEGYKAYGDFMYELGFYGDSQLAEYYADNFGKDTSKYVRSELHLEDYKNALDVVEKFLTEFEKMDYCSRLKDLAFRLEVYNKHFVEKQEPSVISPMQLEKTVNLLQFMQRYCEKKSTTLLRYRRKSLNDAHARKAITLPDNIGDWKSGQTKYFKAIDLIKKWKEYSENLPNLPELKEEYVKFSEA
jgi:hypothetical protein